LADVVKNKILIGLAILQPVRTNNCLKKIKDTILD
jgi:hypothetical protein